MALALGARLGRFVSRRRAARRAAKIAREAPPSWSLSLLVDVDEVLGLFRPSVQLCGTPVLWQARIRLELVDERGVIRVSRERPLPSWAIGTEFSLPAFPAPDGAGREEVLRWHWDVVVEDERRERARWREHPAEAGRLNAEAELDLRGLAAF